MDLLVWILLPSFVAAGSALLATIVMQARMDSALARQKEALIEARALLIAQQRAMEARINAAQEEARRKALDEFMADLRVDERSYVRGAKTVVDSRRTLVIQERLYFRNLPLTPWRRHEYAMEEGSRLDPVSSRRALDAPHAEPVRLITEPAATCP